MLLCNECWMTDTCKKFQKMPETDNCLTKSEYCVKLFKMDKVALEFTEDALDMIVDKAIEYKLGALFPGTDHSPEYDIGHEAKVTHKPSKPISIARYDWNGRRRSDLEILIRKALEILRRVGNRYQPKTVLTSLPTTRKIEMMEQALSSIQKLGLEQKSDLDELINETGAKLNHIKSQLRKLEVFFASTFGTKLQNIFGHCCKTFLDIVACPNWTKLQCPGWLRNKPAVKPLQTLFNCYSTRYGNGSSEFSSSCACSLKY